MQHTDPRAGKGTGHVKSGSESRQHFQSQDDLEGEECQGKAELRWLGRWVRKVSQLWMASPIGIFLGRGSSIFYRAQDSVKKERVGFQPNCPPGPCAVYNLPDCTQWPWVLSCEPASSASSEAEKRMSSSGFGGEEGLTDWGGDSFGAG